MFCYDFPPSPQIPRARAHLVLSLVVSVLVVLCKPRQRNGASAISRDGDAVAPPSPRPKLTQVHVVVDRVTDAEEDQDGSEDRGAGERAKGEGRESACGFSTD